LLRSWPRPGSACTWPSRLTPRSPAAASGTPRPTGPIPGICGQLLAEGRLPECWIPPEQALEGRALQEAYHALGREHTAWLQRIHAVFFHQGAPALGEGALRGTGGLAAVAAAATAHLSPAGQQQVAVAVAMLACLQAQMHALRHRLLDAARHMRGARVLAERLYGVGPLTALALTCWLGGAGRFSSARKAVRFAGLDITVHSSDGKGPPGRPPRRTRQLSGNREQNQPRPEPPPAALDRCR
jgi:transposase IS116/IS110/IS902 family protein